MPVRGRRRRKASDDAAFELAGLADGSLTPKRRSQVEAQVAASPELSRRLAEQQQALALTRTAVAAVEAPELLRARIDEQERARRPRPSRRFVRVGAAAVAAAAVAAVGVVTLGSGGSGAHFRAALAPTSLVPAARGEATLAQRPSGWRITLNATGLPHLAGGGFYEAWLRNPAGILVPIGTFNDGRNVTLWAGVAPTRFTTLTVTRERSDGAESSSGEKVLVGTVQGSGS